MKNAVLRIILISSILLLLIPLQPAFGQTPPINPTLYTLWPPNGGAIGQPLDECANLGSFAYALKVEPPSNGTFSSPTNTITISSLTATTFDWSASAGIGAVIVKAGTSANVWNYSPQAFSGTGHYSPVGPSGGRMDISHITFCWNASTPTATSTSTSTITPSATPTTTSTPGSSPTPTATPTITKTGDPTATPTATDPDDPKTPTPPPSIAPATGPAGGPTPLIISMVISTLLAVFGFVLWRKPAA